MAQASPDLLPLRDELILKPGPTVQGGFPSWTLYDPAKNRFFRLGWSEFEMLCRWHWQKPDQIADRITSETTLRIDTHDVEEFAKFLNSAELLRGGSAGDAARYLARKEAGKQGWLSWLLHHYLFIRIPLVRPDRFLAWLERQTGWIYSWAFVIATMLAALLGIYLAGRQWDVFTASFPWFFSFEGVAFAAIGLICSKIIHELGHGLTAKRLGLRVPTMGVALLVLAPVLYTDTSGSWTLKERWKRLAVGSAGVAAECCLAAYALLLWNFLPDGPFRSVVFVWATTTWVLTLLINLSPFMRFDGYYLLSDLIDVPNLQDRSFALARHALRETLFSFGEPPPETFSPKMRRLLIAYAVGTWCYRFVLFLGIALVVYHMFFKALGVLLFAIEIWWFLLRPILRELTEWIRRSRTRPLNARRIFFLSAVGVVIFAFFVPWRTAIHVPAVMTSAARVELFTELPGRIASVKVSPGSRVSSGQLLIELESPDLDYKVERAALRSKALAAQMQASAQDPETRSRIPVLARELAGARSEEKAAVTERERLHVRAPSDGTVVDLAEGLSVGEWVNAGEPVGLLLDTTTSQIEAYIDEADFDRISVGSDARFIPDNLGAPIAVRISAVQSTAEKTLVDAELASANGGPIPTRQGTDETLVPEAPIYRVTLETFQPVALRQIKKGEAVLIGQPESIASRVSRRVLGILIRESGF